MYKDLYRTCSAIVLAPVVRKMDNVIQRINVNKTNHAIRWIVIYPVDSVIQPLNNWGQLIKPFVWRRSRCRRRRVLLKLPI